ncbi:uncharacterized protein TNCV_2878771 [Trichonephila clavipes]|uniref:Uncharacterized protein n=1 Tax=Trichonephila clavipes TaxID=2585209 RepID=A0A8X6W1W4_TRICX|nr:uncharacterized protein TNCV_2878771 [Trichonephila clavipes]
MSFYVTLPSDSSMHFFPENKISHFKTQLPSPVCLKGEWEVGLSEIIYPHSWLNVNETNNYFLYKAGDGNISSTVKRTIDVGCYETMLDIISAVQLVLPKNPNRFTIIYNKATKRVKINAVQGSSLLENLGELLIQTQCNYNRESEPVPNEASLSENQETESLKENLKESVVKTEKEVFEDEIFRIVPARYKEKAKNIFQFLKLQESFSWNSDGEIIYKNTVIPGSNIAFLVNDFLRNRKSAPEGRYVFLRALNDVNLPKNLDVNKKLYQNNKIIKKPIMYARRNAWLKL